MEWVLEEIAAAPRIRALGLKGPTEYAVTVSLVPLPSQIAASQPYLEH